MYFKKLILMRKKVENYRLKKLKKIIIKTIYNNG